jgi:hypothetical protein
MLYEKHSDSIHVLLCSVLGRTYAQEPGEADKIRYLISSVETLEG